MKKLLIVFIAISMLFVQPVLGLMKYGDASVERGAMMIIRKNKVLKYRASKKQIKVMKNDVIRVGRRSLVILKTIENATIKMGSNAVFHIRPWKKRKQHGYLRMLYGKMFFKVKKKRGRSRFRFKTATSIIGVKGTAAKVGVASNANLEIDSEEGEPTIIGASGEEHVVPAGSLSFAINGNPATIPFVPGIPQGSQRRRGGGTDLDMVPPTHPGSMKLPSEHLGLGVAYSAKALKASKKPVVPVDEGFAENTGVEDKKEDSGDADFEKDQGEKSKDQKTEPVKVAKKAKKGKKGDADSSTLDNMRDILNHIFGNATQGGSDKTGRVSVDFKN